MVDTDILIPSPAAEPISAGLQAMHEGDTRGDYIPLGEKLFGTHSHRIRELGELDRPHLNVVEIAMGRPRSFKGRALLVAHNGGTYTGIDNYAPFLDESKQFFSTDERFRDVSPEAIKLVPASANDLLIGKEGIAMNAADVVVISSLNANARYGEVRVMLHTLSQLSQQDEYVQRSIRYLKDIAKNPQKDEVFLAEEHANTLALINALLILKEGGKLVYAQHDETGIDASLLRIVDICKALGFVGERNTLGLHYSKPGGTVEGASLLQKVLSSSKNSLGYMVAEKNSEKLHSLEH